MENIKLICGDEEIKVTPQIAQSMLQIQKEMKRKGWELPEDSKYEFINNGLIRKQNKGVSKSADTSKGDIKGTESRKPS